MRPRANVSIALRSMHVALLLSVSASATLLPAILLGPRWWRITLLTVVATTAIYWFRNRVIVTSKIYHRILIYLAVFLSPYVAMLLAETVNAVYSGNGVFTVRAMYIRLIAMLAVFFSIFLASGGGADVVKGLRALLRPYVYLCVIISIAGTMAWALIQFDLVDPRDWPPPAYLPKKVIGKGGGNVYSTPLYLGFVLYGAADNEILGTHRISGPSLEPAFIALFVTPALFAVPFVFRRKRIMAAIAYTSIVIFLGLVYSVTNVLALLAIGGLILIKQIAFGRMRIGPLGLAMGILFIGLLFLTFSGSISRFGHAIYVEEKSTGPTSVSVKEFHLSLLESDVIFGPGLIRDGGDLFQGADKVGLISVAAFWGQAIMLTLLGCIVFFSTRVTAPLGLSLIYVVLHALRNPSGTPSWPIYMFVVLVAVLAASAVNERKAEPTQSDSMADASSRSPRVARLV